MIIYIDNDLLDNNFLNIQSLQKLNINTETDNHQSSELLDIENPSTVLYKMMEKVEKVMDDFEELEISDEEHRATMKKAHKKFIEKMPEREKTQNPSTIKKIIDKTFPLFDPTSFTG